VGSTTLCNLLASNFDFKVIWEDPRRLDTIRFYSCSERGLVVKGHTQIKLIFDEGIIFDYLLIVIRDPYSMYPSCYFKDITNRNYSYYYGNMEDVIKAPMEHLIEHFLTFKWDEIIIANYEFYFSQIKEHMGIDLWKSGFDKERGFQFYGSESGLDRVGVIHINKLNDGSAVTSFFETMNLYNNKLLLRNDNSAKDKFYYEKYKNFLNQLPKSYFERYKFANDKVLEHFGSEIERNI
jgi:hypothetical protein|tara:strand:+ start:19287 stop:19997 length:711 start_codon:yes stop_codon:yes gene_type:complete